MRLSVKFIFFGPIFQCFVLSPKSTVEEKTNNKFKSEVKEQMYQRNEKPRNCEDFPLTFFLNSGISKV